MKEKFKNLDSGLQDHFIKQGLFDIIIFFFGLILLFYTKSIVPFLVTAIIGFAFAILIYIRLQMCLEEKVVFMDGVIVEIFDKKKAKNMLRLTLERNYIVVKQDDIYIKIYVENLKKYNIDNVVRVFVEPKNMRIENENTYICNGIFLINIIKTK